MYGAAPSCVFLVWCNPGAGGDEALATWYFDVHGPDAIRNGSFSALHRYQACGQYPARFLAVWEGSFATMDEARRYIAPRAAGLRREGRVTEDMSVVWGAMHFLTEPPTGDSPTPVRTLTVLQSANSEDLSMTVINKSSEFGGGACVYRYGDLVLVESPLSPAEAQRAMAGVGTEAMPPRGTYRSVFEPPLPDGDPVPPPGIWVTHWQPIGSLTAADLG